MGSSLSRALEKSLLENSEKSRSRRASSCWRVSAGLQSMEREKLSVRLPYGEVIVKKCWLNDIIRFYPEYDSVRELAEKNNLPLRQVFNAATLAAKEQYGA